MGDVHVLAQSPSKTFHVKWTKKGEKIIFCKIENSLVLCLESEILNNVIQYDVNIWCHSKRAHAVGTREIIGS